MRCVRIAAAPTGTDHRRRAPLPLVDESRTGISESEKQKLIDGELEIDGIENSTFGRIMMTCMLSVDQS